MKMMDRVCMRETMRDRDTGEDREEDREQERERVSEREMRNGRVKYRRCLITWSDAACIIHIPCA